MTIKILNLYAGIGGNRKLWSGDIEVTAVEIDPKIAEIYQSFFPNDKIIVGDAHEFLLNHYNEFDFIWSSPPCQSHSVTNFFLNPQGIIRFPDMSLYQEILFLKEFCKSKFVVENVHSYYEPLIKPNVLGRHYLWSNFTIPTKTFKEFHIGRMNGNNQHRKRSQLHKKLPFTNVEENLLNNCVNPNIGKYVFECAFKEKQKTLLFDKSGAKK